jgi:GntR family transcriptional repressor for pyruvate dehydrogenase complex
MIEAESTELKSYYDKEFHYKIAKIGKNMLIDIVLESTSYLVKNFINKSVEISIFGDDSTEKIYEEHLNIIKAIERHDEKAAVEYMNNHLNKIDRNLL